MPERYNIGNIRASNVAIGDAAKAEYVTFPDARQAPVQAEALQQIQQLIEMLSIHADEIDNPREVQADAEAVEVALSKKKLNRARIETLIGRMAAGVAGVTALANAVDAVLAAVTQLFA